MNAMLNDNQEHRDQEKSPRRKTFFAILIICRSCHLRLREEPIIHVILSLGFFRHLLIASFFRYQATRVTNKSTMWNRLRVRARQMTKTTEKKRQYFNDCVECERTQDRRRCTIVYSGMYARLTPPSRKIQTHFVRRWSRSLVLFHFGDDICNQ